uniref:Uncharacterized protein n=1 Tax=Anguilla anguilla TaxID=7936 RepID=A0A0E9TEK8_ANGAN
MHKHKLELLIENKIQNLQYNIDIDIDL